MTRHIEQFWHREPEWLDTKFGRVATIEAPIDTTFALHRANEPFRRQKKARRVYFPYEARHLDWYLTAAEYSQNPYFATSSSDVSHWNNRSAHNSFSSAESARFQKFRLVDKDRDGSLITKDFLLS
jgi:hypothetical protein